MFVRGQKVQTQNTLVFDGEYIVIGEASQPDHYIVEKDGVQYGFHAAYLTNVGE